MARYREARVGSDAVDTIRDARPGAKVVILFGAWCPDSRREVPGLWRAFDAAGDLPFDLVHVTNDRSKRSERVNVADFDLRYAPTIIVRRAGEEVGRIVESPRRDLLEDFVARLRGRKTGVLTRRLHL